LPEDQSHINVLVRESMSDKSQHVHAYALKLFTLR
jgi:hypothetical protein